MARTWTRVARLAALGLAIVCAACGNMRELVGLSSDIQKEFHLAANVAVNRRGTMRITFSTAALDSMEMDETARETFAKNVATFAKAHYSKASELEEIVITSVALSSKGSMIVSRTTPQYSFPARDLR